MPAVVRWIVPNNQLTTAPSTQVISHSIYERLIGAMFKGEDSITFDTAVPLEEITNEVEEALRGLGRVSITKKGMIDVEAKSKYKTTFAEADLEGSLEQSRKTPTQYTLTLSYNVRPTIICWIIAVLGTTSVCIGFLILLMPFKMKGDLQKDVLKILSSVEDTFT